jgi:hypothetical protein
MAVFFDTLFVDKAMSKVSSTALLVVVLYTREMGCMFSPMLYVTLVTSSILRMTVVKTTL